MNAGQARPVMIAPPVRKKRNLSQGTYSTTGEKLGFSYYDTQLVVASSTSPMNFFQAAQGQPLNGVGGAIKTLQHTDMTTSGQVPRGQRMTIHVLKIMYTAVTALSGANILKFYTMLANTTMEFVITGKDSILTLTLQELLGAATLIIPTVASGTGTELQARIMLPRYHGMFPLSPPIVLAEQTNFYIRVTPQVAMPSSGLDGDYLKLSMSGILERLS